MKLSFLKSASNILIYGYGIEGHSTASFLKKNNISFEIHDDKNPQYNQKKDFNIYDIIIVSAGIKRNIFSAEQQKKCISNTELFFHNLSTNQRKKLIGITGTKGKSMTAKLTHETLSQAGKKTLLAGNIGVAPLDIFKKIEAVEYVILELSSYQLTYLDTSPHIALCTNLFEDHIDWHNTVSDYHKAKSNLWIHQTEEDLFFVPEKYKNLPEFQTKGTLYTCPPIPKDTALEDSIWQAPHYCENFGLVAKLCEMLDISNTIFAQSVQNLTPLPHRLSTIGVFDQKTFVDNAISTNVYSTMADLVFFQDKIGTLLLGGEDRGQDFDPLFEYIRKNKLPTHIIILESNTAQRLQKTLNSKYPGIPFSLSKDMKEAVSLGYKYTPEGKICLLSPSSASWDRYNSYSEKGDDFAICVQTY